MSCARCGFFNIPGTADCLSCGGSLGAPARTATIALEPPRAGALKKAVRKVQTAIVGQHMEAARRSVSVASVLLGFVPALPQIFRRQWNRALAYMLLWTLGAVTSIWLFGTWAGILAAGLTLGIHFASAIEPWRPELGKLTPGKRFVISLSAYVVLLGVMYAPIQAAARNRWMPVSYPFDAPGMCLAGDTLLIRRDLHPEPRVGDLMAARVPGRVYAEGEAFNLVVADSISIDRVLGVAGDTISVQKGRWFRNGAEIPAEALPLNPAVLPAEESDFLIPAGSVYVWPSVGINPEYRRLVRMQLGLVPIANLIGRPVRVVAPFSHRHLIPASR